MLGIHRQLCDIVIRANAPHLGEHPDDKILEVNGRTECRGEVLSVEVNIEVDLLGSIFMIGDERILLRYIAGYGYVDKITALNFHFPVFPFQHYIVKNISPSAP